MEALVVAIGALKVIVIGMSRVQNLGQVLGRY